jgi:hypothetical protein
MSPSRGQKARSLKANIVEGGWDFKQNTTNEHEAERLFRIMQSQHHCRLLEAVRQ